MSTFTCKVCGRTHEGFVEPRPTFTTEWAQAVIADALTFLPAE
jgi:hypothetical protein